MLRPEVVKILVKQTRDGTYVAASTALDRPIRGIYAQTIAAIEALERVSTTARHPLNWRT